MPSNKKILQWNLNSFKAKHGRLEYLISEYNVEIIALQETKIPTNKVTKIRGYKVYQNNRTAQGGGVLLAVHNNIPSMQFNINSQLEVIVVTVSFKNIRINICNLYLPEHAFVTLDILNNLFKSIPDPKIIVGDINAKHYSWGATINCPRGIIISDCFLENDLYTLNDGSPTRYDRFTDTYSHIDISSCSTTLANRLDWNILPYFDKL